MTSMSTEIEKPNPHPEVHDHGQIGTMTLPEGWVEAPPREFMGGIGTRALREFYPPEQPEARLYLYYRGLPVSTTAGARFHKLLQAPPHNLTENELQLLSEALEDKANPDDFIVSDARIDDWNGKRVLVIEGKYTEVELDCLELFIDASSDGRAIQEVYYQAPHEVYSKYLPAARASLQSITWKPDTD